MGKLRKKPIISRDLNFEYLNWLTRKCVKLHYQFDFFRNIVFVKFRNNFTFLDSKISFQKNVKKKSKKVLTRKK